MKWFCNISAAVRAVLGVGVLASALAGSAVTSGSQDPCSESGSSPELGSPARHYSLKLSSLFTPQSQLAGLIVKARIDGGPVLRFLLDSGAGNVFVGRRAAALLQRTSGPTLELVGFGAASGTTTRVTSATLEIGDLILRDCDIMAIDGKLPEDFDGIMPLSLFAGFAVRLDIPGRTLDLDPYPSGVQLPDAADAPARTDNCMLFLPAVLNESKAGYVLLDTGSSYNVVSLATAHSAKGFRNSGNLVPLLGGVGTFSGFQLPQGFQLRVGSQVLAADQAIVADLSDMSRRHQFEIAGILGYPALRRSVVTINYRDGLVRIAGK